MSRRHRNSQSQYRPMNPIAPPQVSQPSKPSVPQTPPVQSTGRRNRHNTLPVVSPPVPAPVPTPAAEVAPAPVEPSPQAPAPVAESRAKNVLNRIQASFASMSSTPSPAQALSPAPPVVAPAQPAAIPQSPAQVPVQQPAPVQSAAVKPAATPVQEKKEIVHQPMINNLDAARVPVSKPAPLNADMKDRIVKQVMETVPAGTVSAQNLGVIIETLLSMFTEVGPIGVRDMLLPIAQLVLTLASIKNAKDARILLTLEIYKALVGTAYNGRVPPDMQYVAAHGARELVGGVTLLAEDPKLAARDLASVQARRKKQKAFKKSSGCGCGK